MEEEIVEAENRIREKVQSLQRRIQPRSTTPTGGGNHEALIAEPAPIQFYPERWKKALLLADEGHIIDSLQSFIEEFNSTLSEKADKEELPEKVDRHYVDGLIKEVNTSVHDLLESVDENSYSSIREKIQQSHSNLEVIRQHFEQTVGMLHKELAQMKEDILADPEEEEKTHYVPARTRKTATTSSLMFTYPTITRPSRYREKYRKRKRPFQPAQLDDIIGKPLE